MTVRRARPEGRPALYDICLRTGADGRVGGHVLGARDTAELERRCEETWWPLLRRRYLLDRWPDRSADADADAAVVHLLHQPPRAHPDVLPAYPSQLHVDLLPEAGQRVGTAAARDAVRRAHRRPLRRGAPRSRTAQRGRRRLLPADGLHRAPRRRGRPDDGPAARRLSSGSPRVGSHP